MVKFFCHSTLISPGSIISLWLYCIKSTETVNGGALPTSAMGKGPWSKLLPWSLVEKSDKKPESDRGHSPPRRLPVCPCSLAPSVGLALILAVSVSSAVFAMLWTTHYPSNKVCFLFKLELGFVDQIKIGFSWLQTRDFQVRHNGISLKYPSLQLDFPPLFKNRIGSVGANTLLFGLPKISSFFTLLNFSFSSFIFIQTSLFHEN